MQAMRTAHIFLENQVHSQKAFWTCSLFSFLFVPAAKYQGSLDCRRFSVADWLFSEAGTVSMPYHQLSSKNKNPSPFPWPWPLVFPSMFNSLISPVPCIFSQPSTLPLDVFYPFFFFPRNLLSLVNFCFLSVSPLLLVQASGFVFSPLRPPTRPDLLLALSFVILQSAYDKLLIRILNNNKDFEQCYRSE